MLAMYAGTGKLKADYVQMAHHGQNGVERDFYEGSRADRLLLVYPPLALGE